MLPRAKNSKVFRIGLVHATTMRDISGTMAVAGQPDRWMTSRKFDQTRYGGLSRVSQSVGWLSRPPRAGLAALADRAAVRPTAVAPAITVTVDATFIRGREDDERHFEVRVGNVETTGGGRQVFGGVAKTATDIEGLIRTAGRYENPESARSGKASSYPIAVISPLFQSNPP